MSAAIQLVNQPLVNPNVVSNHSPGNLPGNLVEGHFNNVSRFEAAPEHRLRRAIEYIAELQAEVRTLREELAHSERLNANYEVLLRNAFVREQELRAQLASEML
jgi:hypothetical protein